MPARQPDGESAALLPALDDRIVRGDHDSAPSVLQYSNPLRQSVFEPADKSKGTRLPGSKAKARGKEAARKAAAEKAKKKEKKEKKRMKKADDLEAGDATVHVGLVHVSLQMMN